MDLKDGCSFLFVGHFFDFIKYSPTELFSSSQLYFPDLRYLLSGPAIFTFGPGKLATTAVGGGPYESVSFYTAVCIIIIYIIVPVVNKNLSFL